MCVAQSKWPIGLGGDSRGGTSINNVTEVTLPGSNNLSLRRGVSARIAIIALYLPHENQHFTLCIEAVIPRAYLRAYRLAETVWNPGHKSPRYGLVIQRWNQPPYRGGIKSAYLFSMAQG
jgi:hypothetical protein